MPWQISLVALGPAASPSRAARGDSARCDRPAGRPPREARPRAARPATARSTSQVLRAPLDRGHARRGAAPTPRARARRRAAAPPSNGEPARARVAETTTDGQRMELSTPSRTVAAAAAPTPVLDWSDAQSLRRELARLDAKRVTIAAALARLGDGAVDDDAIVIVDSSASEASDVYDLTQETVAPWRYAKVFSAARVIRN